ncbi:hypothetical protein KR067_003566 [Drosophila pandora]|nr:hypothetical protein KR067_003566 [Drosophila pandora]
MANNTNARKLVNVSEEAAPPVQMPVVVGNELFVLTQQDIRRVEDIRVLSYNRVSSNGQICPMGVAPPVNNAFSHAAIQTPLLPPSHGGTIQDLLPPKQARFLLHNEDEGKHLLASLHNVSSRPPKTVASVATQLGWCKHTEEPRVSFTLKLNAATSTGGLMTSIGCQKCSTGEKRHTSCQTQTSQSRSPTPDSTPKPAIAPNPGKKTQHACCQTQDNKAHKACNTSASHVVWKSSTDEADSTSDEPAGRCGCRHCKSTQATKHPRCPADDPCTFQSTNTDPCAQFQQRLRDLCSRDEQGLHSRGSNPRSQSYSPASVTQNSQLKLFPYKQNRYYREVQDDRRRHLKKSQDDYSMTE